MKELNNELTAKGHSPVSVWVLGLSWTALPALLSTFLRHGRFTLHFTGSSPIASALALVLRVVGILASPAQRVEHRPFQEPMDDPNGSNYRIHAGTTEFTERFLIFNGELLKGLAYPNPRVRADRVVTNLRNAAGQTTYHLLAFLYFARHQEAGTPPRRLVIVSRAAVLANSIPPEWAGPDLEFHTPWNRYNSLSLALGRSVLHYLAGSLRRRRQPVSRPSSIGVATSGRLDPREKTNDLYWWWNSEIPAERILLYFDRPFPPVSQDTVAAAERLGIQYVVLNPRAASELPHLRWRSAPGQVISLRRLWRKCRVFAWGILRGTVGRWAACRVLALMHHADTMEDFLVEFNLRGLFHYQDAGLDYLSLACDAAGAARIGEHSSNQHWPAAYAARLHQVYFAWGPHYASILRETDSRVDHILLSGCIVHGAYPNGADGREAMKERTLATSHGASRVLAIFDTSFRSDNFYEFFVRRVIQDPRWCLLIKPKNPYDRPWMLSSLPEFQTLFEQALATGRVRLLDWRLSPAEAAAAADFAVGVGINSATIISAMSGCRSIHLDYARLHQSPLSDWAKFYRAGPDRLVFDDPDTLWDRLNRYFDEPGSDPGLGAVDESLLLDIDPFRDGGAGQRMWEYLTWYLAGLDQELGRDLALKQASRQYADKWGADKVVRGLAEVPEQPSAEAHAMRRR